MLETRFHVLILLTSKEGRRGNVTCPRSHSSISSGLAAQCSGLPYGVLAPVWGFKLFLIPPRGTNATPFFFRLRFSGADSRCLAVRRASASSGLRARGPAAASRVSQSSAGRRSPGCDRQPALLLSLRRVCRSPSVSQRRCFSSAAVCGDQCVLVAGLPGREKHPKPCVSR